VTVFPQPGVVPFTQRTPRVVAARRLQRRRDRDTTGWFLAEGPQAVREALRAARVREIFASASAFDRFPDLTTEASLISDDGLAALAETVNPQGLVAVCAALDVPLAQAVGRGPRLTAVLADIRDPGNAGTVLRSAEAAGAGGVVFCDGSVDVFNPKTVRASAGSLFHVPVVASGPPAEVLARLGAAGFRRHGTVARGGTPYDEADLTGRVAVVLGNEAHGLPDAVAAELDGGLTIPMAGRAESLNVGMAAAVVCFEALRQRRRAGAPDLSPPSPSVTDPEPEHRAP
jgi:TrmH family RNA methyltransferase